MMRRYGFTLLELVTGLLISSVLLVVLCDLVYVAYSISMKQHDVVAIHDQALTTAQVIRHDVALSGYLPCQSAWHRTRVVSQIPGWEHFFEKQYLIKTDNRHLLLHYSSPRQLSVVPESANELSVIKETMLIEKGEVVVVSDCQHAEINQVTAIIRTPRRSYFFLVKPLLFDYDSPVWLGRLIVRDYLVKPTRRRDRSGDRIKALYLKDETGRTREYVENISSFSARLLDDYLVEASFESHQSEQHSFFKFITKAYNAAY